MPVLVDLYGVVSLADVAVRFERAYAKELRGAIRGRIEEFLQKTGLGLSLGAFGISARLQLEPKTDPLPALHALLDLPLRLEEAGGFRALIALDEFQDVGKVPSLDGILGATSSSGRRRLVRLCRLRARADEAALRDKEAPLYGSAVPVRLGRPARRGHRRVRRGALSPEQAQGGEALNPLLGSAKGHPQRRCCLLTGSGRRSSGAAPPPSRTGRAPMKPRWTSSSPEFEAQWRGFDTPSRRRCARSSPARARPTGSRARAACVTKTMGAEGPAAPGRRAELEPGAASRSSSIRSSRSGSGPRHLAFVESPGQPSEGLALDIRGGLRRDRRSASAAQIESASTRARSSCASSTGP